ncbi:MAG: ATP-binding protein [Saprospiraceae bacterium]
MNFFKKSHQTITRFTEEEIEPFPLFIIIGAFITLVGFLLLTGLDTFVFSLGFVGFIAFFISFSLGKSEEEEAIAVAEKESYASLIQKQSDEIFLLLDEGKCLYVSPTVETVLSYSPKVFQQNFIKKITHPEDLASLQKAIDLPSLQKSTKERLELRCLDRSGAYQWMELTSKLGFSKELDKEVVILSLRLIESVSLATPQAEAPPIAAPVATEQNSLTGLIAAHDLKEPLRTITNYAGLLKRRKVHNLDQEGQEFVAFIADGAQRMEDLINDIQELSQLDQTAVRRDWMDPQTVFVEVEKGLRRKIETRQATIEYQEIPSIEADSQQLKFVFQNLLENAIKYCRAEKPIIKVACETQEDNWLFSIQDNGIGMPAEFLQAIFTPFRRLHGNGEFEGTGIGLAICKKIINNHEGVIWAESNGLGQGSTFFFSIPRAVSKTVLHQTKNQTTQRSLLLKTKSFFKRAAASIL